MKKIMVVLMITQNIIFTQDIFSLIHQNNEKQYSYNLGIPSSNLNDSSKLAEKNNRTIFWGMGFGYINIGSMRIGVQITDDYSLDVGVNTFEGDATNTHSLKLTRYFAENIFLYFNAMCFDIGYENVGANKTFAMEFYFLRETNTAKFFSGYYTFGLSFIQKNDLKPVLNIHFQIGFNLNL